MQIKLKYEILVSGLYPFTGVYEKNGYILVKNKIDQKYFENSVQKGVIYLNPYWGFCCYLDPETKENVILTFIKEQIIEVDNSNNINEKINNLSLFGEIEELEKILTLELNNNIKFLVKKVDAYDLNDTYITTRCEFAKINVPSLLSTDKELVYEKIDRQNYRLSSGFSYEKLIDLQNNNNFFNRALSMYYSSFNVCDSSVGFTLLFSSLETLLNLSTYTEVKKCVSCSQKVYAIAETISTNVDLLLMGNEDKIKTDLKRKYGKRSKYLHGEKVNINSKDEYELQEYVRKVLLMYWFISMNKSTYNHKEIMKEFQCENYKENILYSTFLTSLNKQPYQKTKEDILNQILKK